MNRRFRKNSFAFVSALVLLCLSPFSVSSTIAQDFDFDKLDKAVRRFSVIVDLKIELAFGTYSDEQEQRLLGTIVSDDGLVVFDGGLLSQNNAAMMLSGVRVKVDITGIEMHTLDDVTLQAEYVGTDRFTRLAFARINGADTLDLEPVDFAVNQKFQPGDWIALYMLLPEYVSPPLAADIGMVSTLIESPEKFTLIVGFSDLELGSVLFNRRSEPVGVLGSLLNPGTAQNDGSGLLGSYGNFAIPLLGVITGERLQKLIADPPEKGKIDRAWLGITLQALTKDIAEFLELDVEGGIIVNDVVGGSPAEKAGLATGDVIYEIDGMPVEVNREERLPIFQRAIAEMGPGTSVEFSVLRPGESVTDSLLLLTVLEKAPLAPSDAPEYENKDFEFTVRDLVFADYNRYNQDESTFHGVVVSELQRGGLAMVGRLHVGDVVQRIGNTEVTSVGDAEAAMNQIESEKPGEVVFFVWRHNRTMFVNVKTDWE